MQYNRKYNFSAGPAMLPTEVLEQVRDELMNFEDNGFSIMECSHRSPVYSKIHNETSALLREIMQIPEDMSILFASGGAHYQFSAVPLNLHSEGKKAAYIVSGTWSNKASIEAERLGADVEIVANTKKEFRFPKDEEMTFPENCSYAYYCENETIEGVQPNWVPTVPEGVPLVCDMSSNFMSHPIDWTKIDVAFACAQKNFAFAGLTLVVVRNSLLRPADSKTPILMSWKKLADTDSLMNTPPTFNIYFLNRVCHWLKKMGGMDAMYTLNKEKAALLWDFVEKSENYGVTVMDPNCRSIMNVPFVYAGPLKESGATVAEFLEFAKERGLVTLKGHRDIPDSFRASMYNAMPKEGVVALIEALKAFGTSKGF